MKVQPIILTADTAVELAMRKRGYVVVGTPAAVSVDWGNGTFPTRVLGCGETLSSFGGRDLKAYVLVVNERTTRRDYDQQFELFRSGMRPGAKNPAIGERSRFYRCTAVQSPAIPQEPKEGAQGGQNNER